MKKTVRYLAILVNCGLVIWLMVLQVKRARLDRERSQLQEQHESLATQYRQASEELEALRREMAAHRAEETEFAELRAEAVRLRDGRAAVPTGVVSPTPGSQGESLPMSSSGW